MAQPAFAVLVDFTHDPTSTAAPTQTDLTSRVLNLTCFRGRMHEQTQNETGQGSVVLRNQDGALDPTNTSSTYNSAGKQVLPYRSLTAQATYGGTTYNLANHYVEHWPLDYTAEIATSPLTTVDGFTLLNAKVLAGCYLDEQTVDLPLYQFPLNEAAGSAYAVGKGKPSTTAVPFIEKGATAANVTFGTAFPLAETVNALTLTKASSSAGAALSLGTAVDAIIQSAAPWTVEFWVATTDANANYLLARQQVGTNTAPDTRVGTGGGKLVVTVGNTVVANGVTGAALNDGKPHHVCVSSNGTNVTAYLDGGIVGGPIAATPPGLGTWWLADVPTQANTGTTPTTATYAALSFYPSSLSAARILAHYNAGATAFAGETADTRLARLLSYAGWVKTETLDTCVTTMQPATGLAGVSVLTACQGVEAAEGGSFFINAAGAARYISRRTRQATTTSAVTFGENTAAGEVPYTSVAFDFDPTYIYNDVQITKTGAATYASTDATSQAHYFVRTLQQSLSITSDAEALDASNWLLNTYKDPHLRVATLVVDAAATTGAWAALLPRELGDRVTIKRRAVGSSNVISVDFFVERIEWSIDPNGVRATCALTLSPVGLQALIADNATFGVCDSTFVAAY